MMNANYTEQDFCYHHPNHAIVGVCPFCLNDKLLAVAAKQIRRCRNHHRREEDVSRTYHSRKLSNVDLTKIFALGNLINRLEFLRLHNGQGTCDCDEDGGGGAVSDAESTFDSLEDSFISIQFEEHGVALWDKSKVSNASEQKQRVDAAAQKEGYLGENGCKSVVVEHKKTMGRGSLRWRKQIGHLFQLVRCKRSSKGQWCNVISC